MMFFGGVGGHWAITLHFSFGALDHVIANNANPLLGQTIHLI